MNWPVTLARIVAIIIGMGLWYLTQSLIGKRGSPADGDGIISDGVHHLTRHIHGWLFGNARAANGLLIASSLVIDLLGAFLLGAAIFGKTFEPFLGLLMMFGLRQICQAFCPLPPPRGMIWRSTGFPTILVTYGTANDFFFSGHTAIAIYGAIYLAATLGPVGAVLGVLIAVFEIGAVLVLRAHYTMDVFTGAIIALYVYDLSVKFAPAVDHWIGQLVAGI